MPEPLVGNAVNTVAQLRHRIACNRCGLRSFPGFVVNVLDLHEDDCVLDIGCGLGAQLIPVADRVSRIVGLDVSTEMVDELRTQITRPNVTLVVGNMDHITDLDLDDRFTLAYSIYSLYYSRDPRRVIRNVAALLGGTRARFVSINPDVGNNAEWFDDLGQLFDIRADARGVPDFCRRNILPAFLETFGTVTQTPYHDQVRFANLDALMRYYDACAPYCRPDKREEALRYFRAKFDRQGSYQITKCSLALVGAM